MQLKKHLIAFMATLAGICSADVHAWDGIVNGFIEEVHASIFTGNYDLRIKLKGNETHLCGSTNAGAAGWAGRNSNEPNYKSVQAVLLMAAATGRAVTICMSRDAAGYCKIGYVAMRG